MASNTQLFDGAEWRSAEGGKIWDGTAWVPMTGGGAPEPEPPKWTRPAEWLPTNVTAGEQKIQFLIHCGGPSDPITSRQMTVSASGAAYRVDWGDGSALENFASGILAKHQYAGTGLTALGNGYQALITVTPQSGVLTVFDISQSFDTGKTYSSPVMEIVVGPGTITNFVTSNSPQYKSPLLYRIEFKSPITVPGVNGFSSNRNLREILGAITVTGTGISSMFSNCHSLRVFPSVTCTAQVTTTQFMFYNCYAMRSTPSWLATLDTSKVTNFANMFNNCYSLTVAPALNTAAGTDFASMFSSCYNLASVPDLDTSKGVNFSNMFNNCYALRSAPNLNTASGTNLSNMFYNCYLLTSVPALNTAAGTNFSNMFGACSSLTTIPALNTAAGTNFSNMFYNCYALSSVPALNTAAGTLFNSMFGNCYSLSSIPALNTAAGTNVSSMFSGCEGLIQIEGQLNLSGATSSANLSGIFSSCNALRFVQISAGPKYSFTVVGMLDAATLNAIYTSLPTITGQTITVTNIPGGLGDDPTIATGKGWAVTGT